MVNYYEAFYKKCGEPWSYSFRGAEIFRHQRIPEFLTQIKPKFGKVLDIGCSLGQLTRNLATISDSLFATDISPTAVAAAKKNCNSSHSFFLAGALPGLPFLKSTFDLVIAADAIHEFVPMEKRRVAFGEILDLLKEDGVCLLCDYLKPKEYRLFINLIEENGFKIVKTYPLYDRLWYSFESWFKAVRHWNWVRRILSSLTIVRFLSIFSRVLGDSGSRHVLILASKRWKS